MEYDLEIRVHSGLDKAKPCIKLWYLAKAISCSGTSLVSISRACITLGVSHRTLQHYLTDGKRLGYFRDWRRVDKDTVIIYYSSLISICSKYGYSLGYSAFISVNLLPSLKQVTAEITAQAIQAASRKAARKGQKNLGKKKINLPRPEHYFVSSPSELPTGVLETYKGLILTSQSIVPYGASVNGISRKLDRHPQTIKRRLKNTEKVRMAHRNYLNKYEMALHREEWSSDLGKFFTYKGSVYKLHTNLYNPLYQLSSCKQLKRRLSACREK